MHHPASLAWQTVFAGKGAAVQVSPKKLNVEASGSGGHDGGTMTVGGPASMLTLGESQLAEHANPRTITTRIGSMSRA